MINQPSCVLDSVNVDLPIIESGASLKKAIFSPFMRKNDRLLRQSSVVHALRDISLEFSHGDRIGLIGPNGAGKTTMLRLLSGSYFPSKGTVSIRGSVTALLNVGVGMDFDMSGYENIETCSLILGMSPEEAIEKREEISEFSGLGDFIHRPVRTYSSGMMLRLSFAIATSVKPDILLIDEIIGVGDALFAIKAKARIEKLVEDSRTLVIASHDDGIIRQFCNKAVFIENGRVMYFGDVENAVDAYSNWRSSVTG